MTDSWRLKIDRAERHLCDLTYELRRFHHRHAYEVLSETYAEGENRFIRFLLHVTAQPDETIPAIIGDVIHNLRSALDHLVVANVPNTRKSKAGFPIMTTSPFGPDGQVLDNDHGKAWTKMATGLDPLLMEVVERLQPFNPPTDPSVIEFCKEHGLKTTDAHALSQLRRLDNADKHRELIVVASGLMNPQAFLFVSNQEPRFTTPPLDGMIKDGTQIIEFDLATFPPDAEVDVQITGAPLVGIEIRKDKGALYLPGALERLIDHVREIASAFERIASSLSA